MVCFFFLNWPELYDDLSGSSLASESNEQRQIPPPSSDRVRHDTERNEPREMESKGDMVTRYGDGAEEIHAAKYSNDEQVWSVFHIERHFPVRLSSVTRWSTLCEVSDLE